MKTSLHFLNPVRTLSVAIALFLCSSVSKAGTMDEDSCHALMLVTPDFNDPLLIHFSFIGMVPINSFQFLGIWDFGDGNLSTDSCPDHLFAQPGTYTVCLSFSICIGGGLSCHDDTCEVITIGNINGIENADGQLHSFYSYPNPVRNEFHIRSDPGKDLLLSVRDVSGRIVLNGRVKNDQPIDASAFSSGIYILEASDGINILKRKLFVQK